MTQHFNDTHTTTANENATCNEFGGNDFSHTTLNVQTASPTPANLDFLDHNFLENSNVAEAYTPNLSEHTPEAKAPEPSSQQHSIPSHDLEPSAAKVSVKVSNASKASAPRKPAINSPINPTDLPELSEMDVEPLELYLNLDRRLKAMAQNLLAQADAVMSDTMQTSNAQTSNAENTSNPHAQNPHSKNPAPWTHKTFWQDVHRIEYYLSSLRMTLSCGTRFGSRWGSQKTALSPLHAQKLTLINSIEHSLSLLDTLKRRLQERR